MYDGDQILVGSLVTSDTVTPFIFDSTRNSLQLGEHAAKHTLAACSEPDMAELRQRIRELAGQPDADVRFNTYYCSCCGQWADATTQQWSYTICISCSLDRATEMAEFFAEQDRLAALNGARQRVDALLCRAEELLRSRDWSSLFCSFDSAAAFADRLALLRQCDNAGIEELQSELTVLFLPTGDWDEMVGSAGAELADEMLAAARELSLEVGKNRAMQR